MINQTYTQNPNYQQRAEFLLDEHKEAIVNRIGVDYDAVEIVEVSTQLIHGVNCKIVARTTTCEFEAVIYDPPFYEETGSCLTYAEKKQAV